MPWTCRLALSLLLALAPAGLLPAAPARPNIVVILADDMGFSDIGCYGSEIATPHIDSLAARGLRFTQFSNNARCCPTRASLLTGLYPHQAGVGHMTEDKGFPAYRGYLNDSCVTIAEVLKQAGYRTYLSGKWHVGENKGHWPVDRGFERSYALISGATSYFRLDPGRTLARDAESIKPPEKWHITDAITDNAVTFLKDHGRSEKPFFLYLAYTAPHWPLHALPEDIAKYREKYKIGWDELRKQRHARQVKAGLVDGRWPLTARDSRVPAWEDAEDREDRALRMAVYAAQIDRLDQGVGRVLARLKEMGAEDDTLVLFLADNGGCAEVIDRGKKGVPPGPADSDLSYGRAWANASNTPFRLYKHWVHEGGIATPLIARWPAVIRKAALTHQPGHVMDVMATCVEVAGAKYPENLKGKPITPLQGKSLLPVFQGKERPGHEALFWEHEGNKAVRVGKWKLVAHHGGTWELYDLEADRTETKDLAEREPRRVKELAAKWQGWAKKVGVRDWPRKE